MEKTKVTKDNHCCLHEPKSLVTFSHALNWNQGSDDGGCPCPEGSLGEFKFCVGVNVKM